MTTALRTGRAGGRRSSGLLMAAPALLLFGMFGLVPLVGVVVLGLARWDGLGSVGWAGGANWSAVLTDGATWQALWLTVKVMVISWLVQTPVALALGLFQAPRGRLRALFAVLFFLPLLLSAVAIGLTGRRCSTRPSVSAPRPDCTGWRSRCWAPRTWPCTR